MNWKGHMDGQMVELTLLYIPLGYEVMNRNTSRYVQRIQRDQQIVNTTD